MRIGKRGAVGLLLAAALLALAFAVPAFAETEDTDGPVGFVGGVCRGVGSMAASIADLFGMSTDELKDARVAGESLSEIAADQGVDEDSLIDLLVQRRLQMLERAVANQRITQEEADEILAQTKEQLTERIDDPTVGPAAGCGEAVGKGAGCGGPVGGDNAGCIGADGQVGGPSGAGCGLLGGPKTGGTIEPGSDGAPTVGTSSI